MQETKRTSRRLPASPLLSTLLLPVLLTACGEEAEYEYSAPAQVASSQSALTGTKVRLMAANISSGNKQSYDPGDGTRIFQGTAPDVVMIQEFNFGDGSASAIRGFVDDAFGKTFSYYREGGAQIPNGIISRWPILDSGEWDDTAVSNRDFAWARIDIPGPKDLWAISVHLLTSGSGVRSSEAAALTALIKANIPAGDYLAIGGDFNSDNRAEALFGAFSAVVSTAGPYPADRNGNVNTNASRGKPYDHVLVDGDLVPYQTATVIGASTFPAGLVVDTRTYSPIAEIAPARSSDSAATNMQHMAIIKDFVVPGDTVTAGVTVKSPNGGESFTAGSAQSITWASAGIANVKLEYTLDGTRWATLVASTPAAAGSYAWTLPAMPTRAALVRVSDAANPAVSDTSDAAFSITTGGTGTGLVYINEVLANEAGSDVDGEFVELVNGGTGTVDLSGWTLSDVASLRHVFRAGTKLGPNEVIVVFGGAGGIPAGTPGALAASTGALGLSNGGDTVTLRDAAGASVSAAGLDASLTGTDGVSANRSPDASSTGTFVLHTKLARTKSSPGRRVTGAAF